MNKMDNENFSRRTFLIGGSTALALTQTAIGQSIAQSDDCVFCRIVSGKLSTFKIWEDKNHLAFLDHKPIMPGHALVIPKRHAEYIFDLSESDYTDILKRARRLAIPLRTAMNAKRIGVIVEGFGVNHIHIHLVPINGSNELMQKGKTGVSDDEFKTVAEKIKAELAAKR